MKRILFLFLFLSGCANHEVKTSSDSKTTAFQTAGVERFFMTDLPAWAHFSQNGKCLLNPYRRFIEFLALKDTYQLTFLEITELQIQYNEKWLEYVVRNTSTALSPQEEAQSFYEILERVRGGVKRLKFPLPKGKYKIFWKEGVDQNFFQENAVLVSLCKTTQELESWVEEQENINYVPYLIGSDVLSIFSDTLNQQNVYLSFPWNALFENGSELETSEKFLPSEFNTELIKQIVPNPKTKR